jgi:hypothetical protein
MRLLNQINKYKIFKNSKRKIKTMNFKLIITFNKKIFMINKFYFLIKKLKIKFN